MLSKLEVFSFPFISFLVSTTGKCNKFLLYIPAEVPFDMLLLFTATTINFATAKCTSGLSIKHSLTELHSTYGIKHLLKKIIAEICIISCDQY